VFSRPPPHGTLPHIDGSEALIDCPDRTATGSVCDRAPAVSVCLTNVRLASRNFGVVGEPPEGPPERRNFPPELLAKAAANPGGSVYEIDGSQVPDPNGYVPPEAIIGEFTVDENGQPTGIFRRNPKYGPIRDDFTRLTDPPPWLGWLPGEPSAVIRTALLKNLTDQIPRSTLEWVKITEEPAFRTGFVSDPNDTEAPNDMLKGTVTRAGLALAFVLSVVTPTQERYFLRGGFSWAATCLDRPWERKDRTWFEVDVPFSQVASVLEQRVYFDRE